MGLEEYKVVNISELSEKYGDKITVLTKEAWVKKGTELFGADMMKWRFICPACKNIAAVEDFRVFKNQGAQPDSATHDCIGRYDGHMDVVMGAGQPCNYTGYGFFNLCPVRVIDHDGKEISCFAFDDGIWAVRDNEDGELLSIVYQQEVFSK
jgi:hypothetical protein